MNMNIYIIILIILLYVIYNLNLKKETFINNIENTKKNQYKKNISFDIKKQCNNNIKNYIGLKCFMYKKYNNLKKKSLDNNWSGTHFYNYLKNTPLLYDGIYDKKCVNKLLNKKI